MMGDGRAGAILLAVLATGGVVLAERNAPTEAAPDVTEPAWEISASAYAYLVPEETNFVQPTITADRGGLHLEARYNYEDLHTVSMWGGYTFGFGEEATFEITPMLGAVYGDTDGIAPGYRGSFGWRWLEVYSEGEYVIDTGDGDDSFFYAWSEVAAYPVEWLRAGLVGQRTRVYDSPREIQRGLLVGVAFGDAWLTAYFFNPDDSDPLYVIAAGYDF